MNRQCFLILLIVAVVVYGQCCLAAPEERIALPSPRMEGGLPLMQALHARASQRDFSQRDLPLEVLSDLLWAAWGINRPETKGRTAPSAHNWQEIELYVAMKSGLYRYDAVLHTLFLVLGDDLRALTGTQPFVAEAPLNIIYVADTSKMGKAEAIERKVNAASDSAFISQNVYLYCASEGLATVVRGSIDAQALKKVMGLTPSQEVVLAQTVGYPRETDEKK